jgi:PAS domain-containing protein
MSPWGPSAAAMGLEQVLAQMPAAVMVVEAPSRRIVHANVRAREMTERQLGRPIPVQFEAYSPRTASWLEVHAYPSKDGLSVYSRDVSERKRAEEEINRRAEQQALVAELGQRALTSDDLQSLLDDAVALVVRTLDVEFAGVAELAPGGEEIIFRAGVGWLEGVVGRRIEREGPDSLMGHTLRCREPVIVEDMATDRRFKASAIARTHGSPAR